MGLPVLAIPALMTLVSAVITAGIVSIAFIIALKELLRHLADGIVSESDAIQLQAFQVKLDEFLKSLFDMQQGSLLPRSGIIVPSDTEHPYRLPLQVNGGGLKGGGGNDGLYDEPDMLIYDANGNLIYFRKGRKKPWPRNTDVPEFCGPTPWTRGPKPGDPDSSGTPLPVTAAAGHVFAVPAIAYNVGMAGGITVRDFTSQGVFHIRKFQRSGVVTVHNKTDDVFILGDPFGPTCTEVTDIKSLHGSALATSTYCFPGQSFQVGGVSKGAGVEASFRIQAWNIPRGNADPELLEKVKAQDSTLEIFMLKAGEMKLVSNIFVFIDIPWVGGNRINVIETQSNDTNPDWKIIADNYQSTQDVSYTRQGRRYSLGYMIPKGENPVGEVYISNR